MDVNIQSLKFDASKQLIEFVEKKMSRLERFADRPTGVDVVLRLEKDDEKGNNSSRSGRRYSDRAACSHL